jgi:hypothetical protein
LRLQRAFLIVIAGVLTGVTTEIGRQIVISEQFHQIVLSRLPRDHAPDMQRPGMPSYETQTSGSAVSTPQTLHPGPPPAETFPAEGNRHVPVELKCRSSVETPWQRDAEGDSIIWKCMGRRYFAFQCTADDLALVTYGVNPLKLVRFLRSEHDGGDAKLVAEKATPYYYYALSRQMFTLFKYSSTASFVQDDSKILRLDLTSVRHLSDLAFSGCPGA